jgi:hypothetical protein
MDKKTNGTQQLQQDRTRQTYEEIEKTRETDKKYDKTQGTRGTSTNE